MASRDYAVRVAGVGKKYELGQMQAGYKLLTEAVTERVKSMGRRGRAKREELWAVDDVSFDVERGERLGIIGHNGAGKSTLLKLLARVTPPSRGEIRLRGRVGALLEVGTGFNGQLTGRENIYLNGAILGMSRAEIGRKFDEIVSFAEVERFIDTPVKRYSSGMYLRLAFAVAAHLEPDVLIVDEVLSVGDLRFQEKCIGRMQEVASEGRTILFVSHNLAAVTNLCPRSILLSGGRKMAEGRTEDVVSEYVRAVRSGTELSLKERADRHGNGTLRFSSVRFEVAGNAADVAYSGHDLDVIARYESKVGHRLRSVNFAFAVYTMLGGLVLQCESISVRGEFGELPPRGEVRLRLPRCPLPAGQFFVTLFAHVAGDVADWVSEAAQLTVAPGDFYGTGRLPSESHTTVLVDQEWSVVEEAAPEDARAAAPAVYLTE
jgi:lipopolysaccharide transport system ATP-binding protein